MRAWLLRLVLVLATLATAARAQVGVYGKGDYTRYTEGGSTASFTGGGVGIYDDFLHAGPASIGLDLRGDYVTQDKANYRSLLAGVRVALKVPVSGLRPYAQALIGVGGSRAKGPFAVGITNVPFNNKLTYEGVAGVDLRVLPHIDWRVLELAVGSQSKLDSTTPLLFNISTGLVVRF